MHTFSASFGTSILILQNRILSIATVVLSFVAAACFCIELVLQGHNSYDLASGLTIAIHLFVGYRQCAQSSVDIASIFSLGGLLLCDNVAGERRCAMLMTNISLIAAAQL